MFYISSQGHSATGWLSRVLSSHEKIVCFHGTRSIPPYLSGIQDQKPHEFTHGLMECEKNIGYIKQFGACHGFYGTMIKSDIEKNGGRYLALIRHPIARCNSIFVEFIGHYISLGRLKPGNSLGELKLGEMFERLNTDKLASKLELLHAHYGEHEIDLGIMQKVVRKVDIYRTRYLRNIYFSFNEKKVVIKERNNCKYIEGINEEIIALEALTCFKSACDRTFYSDAENYQQCNKSQLIKVELMTRDTQYFDEKILQVIQPGEYLKKDAFVNKKYHVNKHTNSNIELDEIYNSWPKIFKDMFQEKLEQSGAAELYSNFEYKIPE